MCVVQNKNRDINTGVLGQYSWLIIDSIIIISTLIYIYIPASVKSLYVY